MDLSDDGSWPEDEEEGPTLIKRADKAREAIIRSLRKPRPPKRRGTGSKRVAESAAPAAGEARAAGEQQLGKLAPVDPSVPPPPPPPPPPSLPALESAGGSVAKVSGPAVVGQPSQPERLPGDNVSTGTITRVAGETALGAMRAPRYPTLTGMSQPSKLVADPVTETKRLGEVARAAADTADAAARFARAAGHAAQLAVQASRASAHGDVAQARTLLMRAVSIDAALQRGEIPEVPSPGQASAQAATGHDGGGAQGGSAASRASLDSPPLGRPPRIQGSGEGALAQLLGVFRTREGVLLMSTLGLALLLLIVLLVWLLS